MILKIKHSNSWLGVLVVLFTLAGAAAASSAGAAGGQFCVDVLIDSGNTCVHGNNHTLNSVSGRSTGSAIACVGSKYGSTASSSDYVYWGNYCAAYGGSTASTGQFSSCNPVTSTYPDIHNHSSFISRFTGTFEYGYC